MKYAKRTRDLIDRFLRLGLLLTYGLPVVTPAQSPVSLRSTYTGEISSVLAGPGPEPFGLQRPLQPVSRFTTALLGQPARSSSPCCYSPHGLSGTRSHANDLNTFSHIDFHDSPRLYELWIESNLTFASLRIGLLALDMEFGVGGTDLSSLFIDSTFGADATVSLNFPAPIRAAAEDENTATGVLPAPSPMHSTELNRHGAVLSRGS